MARYQVAEIFESINGEGLCAGELSVFVRFCGCNLRCRYCDTNWANEKDCPYTWMTEKEILSEIGKTGIKNVTLTGGEPLLQPEIGELIGCLLQPEGGYRVEIETNGSVLLKDFRMEGQTLPAPVFTMDYKLPGSGMESRMLTENYRYLKQGDAVKFVVSDREDLERAYEIFEQYLSGQNKGTLACRILLSPVFGAIEPVEIVDFMKEKKWNEARLQLQLHKIIWAPDLRGV